MACMGKPSHTETFTMGSPRRHAEAFRMHAIAVFSDITRLDPVFQPSTVLDTPETAQSGQPATAADRPSMSVVSRADEAAPVSPPPRQSAGPARCHGPEAASPGAGLVGAKAQPENMHRDPASISDKCASTDHTEPQPPTNDMVLQWRKRPVKSAIINFHSIADLVRPCRVATPPEPAGEGRVTVHTRGTYPHTTTDVLHNVSRYSHHGEQRAKDPSSPPSDRSDEFINVVDEADDVAVSDDLRGFQSTSSVTTTTDLSATKGRGSHPQDPPARPCTSTPATTGARADRDGHGDCSSPPGTSGAEAEAADPSRLRKGRTIYKAQQVYVLEQVFSRTHYPDPEVIETLARELDISENKIKVWFQNKRARWRRRAAETGLPPQPIGFTLTGTPGLPTSWPHSSLPQGLVMPQPIYTPSYPGSQVMAPRPAFHSLAPFNGMGTPLYLDSAMMAAAKGLSPTHVPYGGYTMSLLPSHVWGETSKLHSGT